MTRTEVLREIEQTLGVVPEFFKAVPEDTIEMQWKLFRQAEVEEGPIPNKYRELIGLAIAGVTKCRYCAYYHTEVARASGATDAEIKDALRYAQSVAGWSTWVNGMQTDFEGFKREVQQACHHMTAARRAA